MMTFRSKRWRHTPLVQVVTNDEQLALASKLPAAILTLRGLRPVVFNPHARTGRTHGDEQTTGEGSHE